MKYIKVFLGKFMKSHLGYILSVIIFLCIGISSFGQLSSRNMTLYSEKDGLPGTSINNIIVDHFGYIWVGTINGLAQYDGYKFKRFYENPNDTGSIKGLVVWSLYEDSKGHIWAGCQPGKLNVFDPATKTFRHYAYDHLFDKNLNIERGIYKIIEDNSGRMYFGLTTNYGQEIHHTLLYLDKNEKDIKRFVTPDSLSLSNISSMTKESNGNIWIKCRNGLFRIDQKHTLTKINLKNNVFQPFLKNEFIAELIYDSSGYIWSISNFGRLIKIDPRSLQYELFAPAGVQPDHFYNNLILDKNGIIWMGTNMGFYNFDPKTKITKKFVDDGNKNYTYSPINTMAIDSFGTLWIGTNSTGLFKYEERSFFKSFSNDPNKKNSLTYGWVTKFFDLDDGKILATTAGSHESGLNIIDLSKNEIKKLTFKKYIPQAYTVFYIVKNSEGVFSIATDVGIFEFLYPSLKFSKIKFIGIPDSVQIKDFHKDTYGDSWVLTSQGIYRKKKNKIDYEKLKFTFQLGDEVRINSAVSVVESKKNGLWILTNERLFNYNYKTAQITSVGNDKTKGDIFGSQDINSLYDDGSGVVWVGTWQGGLSRLDVNSGKIKTYTVNDGLPSMSIQSIISDENNQSLWISTFEGMSRFDIKQEKFYNYSIEDGIQSQLFADGSFLKSSNGSFLFGGSNGFTIFDPNNLNIASEAPKVFFTDFKLFNKSVIPSKNSLLEKPIYDTKDLTLKYDQNNITIEFQVLHYSNPLKNKIIYKLENYDQDWRDAHNYHAAFYPNLPPGKYIFKVKAANNNGVWNEEVASLNIHILPPWWNTTWAYTVYFLLTIIGIFFADRYFRYRVLQQERQKNQARELAQAKEIQKAYYKLEESHETLKKTQAQLIQSEKMASLGELTAGIAHEIQNPLNFVNNFSEVNTELIDELREEVDKGNLDEVKAIAKDIKENEQKINHHGKRADAIVKGMLQHSRTTSGQKELTDINALADEYLRLAYHGLRAKDKSFNATMKTEFDESIDSFNIVSQDIGRVLLNLINNAFYAVTEKKKSGVADYEPTVTISTKKEGDNIEIRVKDNGNGIPEKVKEKIFQPFFTTKPTGQGTGLGLSLAYDIVTKGHDGELRVETKEGEGTEFRVLIPI